MSGSMRLSRASTRTSLASDDLDRYMNDAAVPQFGGSTGNIEKMPTQGMQNSGQLQNGFLNENSLKQSNSLNNGLNLKPHIQPRIGSSTSANNNRIVSGRSHDNFVQSAASYDAPGSHIPPPVKVSLTERGCST